MSFTTTYKGCKVDTVTHAVDGSDDPDLYCTNDACPALEIMEWSEPSSVPLGNVATQWPIEISRACWEGSYVRPTGPSYGSGGQPGEFSRPECPECGAGGEPL